MHKKGAKKGEKWTLASTARCGSNRSLLLYHFLTYTVSSAHWVVDTLDNHALLSFFLPPLSLPPVMTGLRKSPSTEAVWSPYPPPAETSSLWCDGPGRWRDEEKTTERATRRKMGGLGRGNGRHLSEEGGRSWGYG